MNLTPLRKGVRVIRRTLFFVPTLTLALTLLPLTLPLFAAPPVADFETQIRPILNQRCIQCHSCYNAPCQLNMTSVEGLDRGLVTDFDVFSPRRLHSAEPSRLGVDRTTTQGWRQFSRKHQFKPVVMSTGNIQQNLDTSLILKLVEHKRGHEHLAVDDLAYDEHQAENSRTCPDNSKKLEEHLKTRPEAGMPYGLPALSDDQIALIKQWTAMGSPWSRPPADPFGNDLALARQIEDYLNRYTDNPNFEEAKRQSLVSRYLYEHLFLAHIYLREQPERYFNLIRSKAPCQSQKLEDVATRRPWNDPELKFYYCLKPIDQSLVHKTHITYLLDQRKLERFQQLFFSRSWKVSFASPRLRAGTRWPSDVAPRADSEASNPFLVYKDIPVTARYQFLLDDAHYHVMTFIKGPVCKGQTAVNSIDEQFYVFFLRPESDLMAMSPQFYQNAVPLMLLPANQGSDQLGGYIEGRKIRQRRNQYRELRDRAYGQNFPRGYSIQDIWNGQGSEDLGFSSPNTNAALTVFRHHDSSAVVRGLVGATSKTAFVLDYSLFERLVYVLVTGYDVYGDVTHQLQTRLYMSYIKMEAEENFLSFFPSSVREPMRKSWYVESESKVEKIGDVVNALLLRSPDKVSRRFPLLGLGRGTQVNLPPLDQAAFYGQTANAQEETLRAYRRQLVSQYKGALGPALGAQDNLNFDKQIKPSPFVISEISSLRDFELALAELSDRRAMNSQWVLKMPSLSLILVESPTGPEIYSMARTKEHFNVAWISGENARRNRAADSLVFYKGILGSYPNHIFRISLNDAGEFLRNMIRIVDHESYEAWIRRFGNPRNGPGSERFWATSDLLHETFQQKYPVEYGAFDYNRYGVDYRYTKDEGDDFVSGLSTLHRATVKDALGEQ